MTAGRFITFEGGEGAGKSTQILALADHLTAAGIETVTTREPGGTPGAEAIRDLLIAPGHPDWLPETEALLQYAARKDHVQKKILPALEAGKWVLSDRFADSTLAYQGFAQGLGYEFVHRLHEIIFDDFQPDLTVVLDLPVETGLARAKSRAGDAPESENRFERMDRGFHENLRTAFQEIAHYAPERCVIINAAKTQSDVAEAIWTAVTEKFEITA